MKAALLARGDRLFRGSFVRNFLPESVVGIYSAGRLVFLRQLQKEKPNHYVPQESLERTLWGLKFRSPIMNSAGMFKNGEGYEVMFRQGAAAFLGGTTTWNARPGNEKLGVKLPFAPYPKSGMASNWLGLPNLGDEVVAATYAKMEKHPNFPLGHSLMASPDLGEEEKLEYLVKGMKLYEAAGVDWLEFNVSCPNTEVGVMDFQTIRTGLEYVQHHFLDQRSLNGRARSLPVVVKFSNDIDFDSVQDLMELLFELGYDGVNIGNASANYDLHERSVLSSEKGLFRYFCETFGGGVSGRRLKPISLSLSEEAVRYLQVDPPEQEFHVFRTGGIESWQDLQISEDAGISMNQWFTGYFDRFSQHGHKLYQHLLEKEK